MDLAGGACPAHLCSRHCNWAALPLAPRSVRTCTHVRLGKQEPAVACWACYAAPRACGPEGKASAAGAGISMLRARMLLGSCCAPWCFSARVAACMRNPASAQWGPACAMHSSAISAVPTHPCAPVPLIHGQWVTARWFGFWADRAGRGWPCWYAHKPALCLICCWSRKSSGMCCLWSPSGGRRQPAGCCTVAHGQGSSADEDPVFYHRHEC